MPRPITSSGRAALQAGHIAVAYLIEATPDEGTQRISSWGIDLTYNSNTYTAGQGKWSPARGIPISKQLVPETFTLDFSGADENDTGEFIGLLLSRTWHQRPIRFYGLLLDTTDASIIDTFYEWRGKMDQIQVGHGIGGVASIALSCESGVFRAQERNMQTIGHNDQKRRDATDTFFRNMPRKQDQQIPYGIEWSKIAGTRGGSTSGGGSGFNTGNFGRFSF